MATENPDRMEDIAAAVRAGLEQHGWQVSALETDPLSARLIVTDPASHEKCEVDILKEALWRPPVHTDHGLVLSLEDVVGTKVRALFDRGLARDLIDVQAAANRWSHIDLEELGRRHARDSFDLSELQARLMGADWIDDTEFAAYGLDDKRSPGCASGRRHGPATSANGFKSWRHRTKTDGRMEARCAQRGARQATRPTHGRGPSVPSRADNSGQVQPPETMAAPASSQERAAQSRSEDSSTTDSQAQSASSILATRSTTEAQVIDPGLVCCPDLSRRPSLTEVPSGPRAQPAAIGLRGPRGVRTRG